MNQTLLFPDLLADRRAAIEADVAAAGGLQKVGELLGLADNAVDAGRMLSNKIQRSGRHDLKDEEVWKIRELARKVAGRSRLHEIECSALHYDGRWLTSEDIKALRRKRRAELLAELIELEQEDE